MTSGSGVDGRPRMVDVGRLAEVSAQTVSRYFTGGYVGAEARRRIEDAVSTLGYRPNSAARRLKSNRSDSIGLVAIGPTNFGIWSMLEGMNAGVRDAGYSLVIGQLDIEAARGNFEAELRSATDHLLRAGVDGVVFSTPYPKSDRVMFELVQNLPLVVVAEGPTSTHNAVRIDSYAAGRLAMGHLLALGHRRVLHLGGENSTSESNQRERSYLDAMSDAGLDPLPVTHRDWTADAGYATGMQSDPDAFTAVFAANDSIASGFVSAMLSRGRTAPHDYSIVGIDAMPDSRYYAPPLTTVDLGFPTVGRVAVEMMLGLLRSRTPLPVEVIAPQLIVRDSTRKV